MRRQASKLLTSFNHVLYSYQFMSLEIPMSDSDSEIRAMGAIVDALEKLEDDARVRVLRWAVARFQPKAAAAKEAPPGALFPEESANPSDPKAALARYDSVVEAFSAAGPPAAGPDKALLVAAFLQTKQGASEFTGQQVNTELKHLGHPVTNITSALSILMERRPQLVIQTRKSGTSNQARKQYRVTLEGLKAAALMLSGSVQCDQ